MIVQGKKKENKLTEIINEIQKYDEAMTENKEFSKEYRDGVHHAFQLAIKIIESNDHNNSMR